VSASSLYRLMLLEDVGTGAELFPSNSLAFLGLDLTLSCLVGCQYVGDVPDSMSSLLDGPWP